MIQVSEERVEQHFPTRVLVRAFQTVNHLHTRLRQLYDQLEQAPHADYARKARFWSTPPKGGYQSKRGLSVLELD